jgi:hypothetical protein
MGPHPKGHSNTGIAFDWAWLINGKAHTTINNTGRTTRNNARDNIGISSSYRLLTVVFTIPAGDHPTRLTTVAAAYWTSYVAPRQGNRHRIRERILFTLCRNI